MPFEYGCWSAYRHGHPPLGRLADPRQPGAASAISDSVSVRNRRPVTTPAYGRPGATLIGMRKTRQGTWLGIPYDWRRPTRQRVRRRWWNRDDHRIFTPKLMGWGYGINLAEVARRLRLGR